MADQQSKTGTVTSIAAAISAVPASTYTAQAAIVLDSISQQNQEGQLLLENLLQSSLIDNNLVTLEFPPNQDGWLEKLRTDNPVGLQGEACLGKSAELGSVSDTRLMRQQSEGLNSSMCGQETWGDNRESVVNDVDDDADGMDPGTESVLDSGGVKDILRDVKSMSRQRSGRISETGRRSAERSESESETQDMVIMSNFYSMDDMRHQMTGSVTPETSDVGFQPSMLDAVLTEKKLVLMRSPEVRAFLQQQQSHRAREQRIAHRSPTALPKGDNS